MRAILPVLLLLTPAFAAPEKPAHVPRKKFSAVSLLPDGSQLQDVMFPRYDENHHLVAVLKAREMTLVDDETIAGATVAIEFFNDDRSPRGRADLTKAVFHQTRGLLEAREPAIIRSDRLNAKGAGLFYSLEKGEGYLIGPGTTWIQNPTETTMNSHPSTGRDIALIGMSLLTLPLTAMPPPPVTAKELAAIHADVAAAASLNAARAGVITARADFAKDGADAAAANNDAAGFIAQTGLPFPDADAPPPEAKPLDVKPGPNDTVITFDGGMYFDADLGVLVYLKNVHVTDPRFDLAGANKLEIFLEKKTAEPPPPANKPGDKPVDPAVRSAPKDPLGSGLGAKFGDVERLVASGAVHFLQKQPEAGKEPIEASGAVLTYHTKSGQIIISGGYPWVKQGPTYMRAEQPNLVLRILKSGSFVTEGKWVMGGPLPQAGTTPKPATPPKPKPATAPRR